MDAIAAHQFGYANVVACMGTAVTEQQIGLVKRLSRNIVLALDADAAGQGATVRSLEMLPRRPRPGTVADWRRTRRPPAPRRTMILWQRRFKSQISIVRLPQGKDPDELIRRDPARLARRRRLAPCPSSTSTSRPRSPAIDPADATAKSAAVRRLVPLLEAAGDQVVQAHYRGPSRGACKSGSRKSKRPSASPRFAPLHLSPETHRLPAPPPAFRTRTTCWRSSSAIAQSAATSCRWWLKTI